MDKIIELVSVNKRYVNEYYDVEVLRDVGFFLAAGEVAAITGPSGSGKSTLLSIAAGIDRPDSGQVLFEGVDLTTMDENRLGDMRSAKIGFVFQNFQLLRTLNAMENVAMPLVIAGIPSGEIEARVRAALAETGMSDRAMSLPSRLSGGEMQRIALARSFVNRPAILFADEPTANLDLKNARQIMKLMLSMNRDHNSTLLIVTHDPDVAKLADRVYELRGGILKQKRKPGRSRK